MPKRVFLSYRRTDTLRATNQLYRALCEVLPEDHVFMDVDTIPLGADFVEFLDQEVGKCDLLLAVIGPNWLAALDRYTRERRPDFVRVEIRQALASDRRYKAPPPF